MSEGKRYNDFTDYLRGRFPGKLLKIPVDAGCTCPNRDGTKGRGGCTYCSNRTFTPAYCHAENSITQQLTDGIRFFSYKYPSTHYLAYFQSFTNTYGDATHLISMYEEALQVDGVEGVIVGTRPDCMPDELLHYFSDLARRSFVMLEYGVESTLDKTLERIRRGHDWTCSAETIRRTAEAGVCCGAHLILGLTGENREEMLHHADLLSELPLTSLKLHQLQIVRGTVMAHEYATQPEKFHLFEPAEYADLVIDFLEHLDSHIAMDRFVSLSPGKDLIAPRWGMKSDAFLKILEQKMEEREARQGAARNMI